MRVVAMIGTLLLLAVGAHAQPQTPDYTDGNKWRCGVCDNVSDLAIKGSDHVVMYRRYTPVVTPDHPTSLVVIYRPINLSAWNYLSKADVIREENLYPWLLIYFTLEAGDSERIYIFEQAGPYLTPAIPRWQLVQTVGSFEETIKFLEIRYGIEQK